MFTDPSAFVSLQFFDPQTFPQIPVREPITTAARVSPTPPLCELAGSAPLGEYERGLSTRGRRRL